MNFQTQFTRLLILNPVAWLWWACAVSPLVSTIFGRQFGGWKACLIFGGLTIVGLLLAIALAKHAVQTRQYI